MKITAILAFACLLAVNCFAQTAITNTGILYISSSSDVVTTGGDFTNSVSGQLTNSGSLFIKANLVNNQASMPVGSGILYFIGTGAQSVLGTQPVKTYNLNTNNTSGVVLNNNLYVSGIHTFINGVITTSSTPNYLVYESGASYTGSSDGNHINGWVKKIGNAGFIFPVGNGTYLREIEISNLSGASEFDARYSGATGNTSNLLSPLVHINPNEFWTLNKVSGGTAQATLNWNQSKIAFPNYVFADIQSAQYNAGNWTSAGGVASGTIATSGVITSNPLSTFGAMSIGSTSYVLPLRFLSISAGRTNNYTAVQWKTANEQKVHVHEVQRSLSNFEFATIGQVPARNKQDEQVYQFNDKDNVSGVVYYRIKSVDVDGKVSFSRVVSLKGQSEVGVKLVHNPVKNSILFLLSNIQHSNYSYSLLSTEGKIVMKGVMNYTGGGYMSLSLLPFVKPGVYMLTMQGVNQVYTFKIIVQ